MFKIKVVALLLLMSSANSLSMELEKAYKDECFDGLIKLVGLNFCYTNHQTIEKSIQTKVNYKIPDCMPVFGAFYKYTGAYNGEDLPRDHIYLPLSCFFINKKEVNSQVVIRVIVEGKEGAFKLVKSLAENASNNEDELLISIKEQYKKFIKSPELYPKIILQNGTLLANVKKELNQNRVIEISTSKEKWARKKNGCSYRNVHTIVHGCQSYLIFMEELSKEKKLFNALLVAVEKECKDKISYFSLLPKDAIDVLKNFMQSKWAHLYPMLEYHEQALKEVEQEKQIIQIVQEAWHQ